MAKKEEAVTALITQELKARKVAQVIVVVKNPGPVPTVAAVAPAGTLSAASAGPVVQSLAQHFVSSKLSQLSALAAAAAGRLVRAQARGRRFTPPPEPVRYYPNLGVLLGTVDQAGFDALSKAPEVAAVTGAPPISLIRPVRVARARLTRGITWGIRALRVAELWAQGLTGNGILVGHLDTGVDGQHPALVEAIEFFALFDRLGREVTPTPAPFDTMDHGTHTAATIAGRPIFGSSFGVAPDATLASAIVIEGGDVIARVLGGMDWAVGNNVRVLSMSLGFPGFWEDFLPLTQLLRARNILPVFAVGNEGPGTSRSPGNYAEALSIGALNRRRQVAYFSSSQRFERAGDPVVPDLIAPGVGVISAKPGGGVQGMDGTSMATPHVAGLAALLMQAQPGKTADEVEAAIIKSCRLEPNMSPDRVGQGVPDAVQALALL